MQKLAILIVSLAGAVANGMDFNFFTTQTPAPRIAAPTVSAVPVSYSDAPYGYNERGERIIARWEGPAVEVRPASQTSYTSFTPTTYAQPVQYAQPSYTPAAVYAQPMQSYAAAPQVCIGGQCPGGVCVGGQCASGQCGVQYAQPSYSMPSYGGMIRGGGCANGMCGR